MTIGHSHVTGTRHRRAVGVFPNRRVAEQALYELRDSGFPMNRVSVISKDRVRDDEIAGAEVRSSVHDTQRVGNKADEGATVGAATGGALGGLTGLLVGLGTLAIPGVGPILLAGATATTIATTLAGGAIGAVTGGLLGALIGLGIPEERARVYHDRISQGDYLVIVDGTDEQIAVAERILQHRGIEEYGVYDAPVAHTTTTTTATTATTATPPVQTAPVYSNTETHLRQRRQAVGFFPHRQDAESAIADLRSAGFPLNQISLVGRHFERRDAFTGIDLNDRFEAARYNMPVEQTRYYNDRFDQGDYLVIIRGTDDEIRRAGTILSSRGIQDWSVYDASGTIGQQNAVVEHSTIPAMQNVPGQPRVEQVSTSPDVVIVDRRNESL